MGYFPTNAAQQEHHPPVTWFAVSAPLALRLPRHDEVVNAHEIGAVRQKTRIGVPLIVGVTDWNPEHDFARLDRLREMRGVPGDEPMAERVVQAACT